ncbi:PAS domain-containing protein [Phenylobacterium sp. 58.2.17]|uniref:PAS domain-containing protein n=1 Tax=Phenylobacterium sp. 58.2.17 TaxID=2969306 RepID=UPI00226415C5|nr:PAS domain-containing protein [Phenylobacterium sp. 58.2.17]MCX7584813.1 PAS domain-containing protein [Phenylobacterium sp. 58.2.17]
MNNGHGEPSVVTAGEISRNFGQWQDRALGGPVIVTHHGRPRVVLVSADYYSTSKEDHSFHPREDDAPSFETGQRAILDHVTEAFMAVNSQLHITAVNHVFEALVGHSASQLVGRFWEDLFPATARSLMDEQLKRALRTGETLEFEAPGDAPGVRRYSFRAFPYPGGVAVLIQNRTAEREMQAQLNQARALDAALSMLPQVMVLRLNVRGVLTTIDPGLAKLLGFSADELVSCRLPDITRPRDRADLTAALEAVLQGGRPSQIATTLLVKDGGELAVRIGLASVIRDLVPDGLVAAVTLDSSQA